MSIAQISLRIEEAKRDKLDAIAKALDRDRSYVVNEAIDHYLDLYRWQLEHIRKGIADSDAGRTHSHEEVGRRLASFMDEHDAKRKAAQHSKTRANRLAAPL